MSVSFIDGGNRRTRRKLYHIMLYQVHLAWAWFELTTLVVIGTDCIGSHSQTTIRSRPQRPLFNINTIISTIHTICVFNINTIISTIHTTLCIRHPYHSQQHPHYIVSSTSTLQSISFILPFVQSRYSTSDPITSDNKWLTMFF